MRENLLLDTNIRLWVFLPIVLLTFFVEIIRQCSVLLLEPSDEKLDVEDILDSHILKRARVLQRNYGYIPKSAFLKRKYAFTQCESAYLLKKRKVKPQKDIMSDPRVMLNVMRGNLTNVYPTILVGGWVNWLFSGFITTKVPFPLTYSFKSMLQRGMELTDLNPSWVSSVSWYLINVVGQKNVYSLIINDFGNHKRYNDNDILTLQNTENTKATFKEEWEAVEIIKHKNLIYAGKMYEN